MKILYFVPVKMQRKEYIMTKVNGIPVDPLINVEVHMYFEVHNSDLWGGKGSVGYMEIGYCECKSIIINELNSDFIERQIEFAANSASVNKKYVRP